MNPLFFLERILLPLAGLWLLFEIAEKGNKQMKACAWFAVCVFFGLSLVGSKGLINYILVVVGLFSAGRLLLS